VAHLGKLGGFDLEEWRVGQLGQAAGDLGFAHAGGANHDDVLRHDIVSQFGGELLSSHAVAQGDGHGAIGGVLAHHVLVEFGNDFAQGKLIKDEFQSAQKMVEGNVGVESQAV